MTADRLPVDAVRGAVVDAIERAGRVVVTAPTGSGKSTRLPGWLAETVAGRVLVVQPRRVAARSLAGFLAKQSGTPLGERVGYAVRFDARFNDKTELVFVTSGLALQWLQSGALKGFQGVVLDEFHERRWELDLLLALLVSEMPSMPLVVTSATLDAESVSVAIDAPVVTSEGRTFPVEVSYAGGPSGPSADDLADRVAAVVRAELEEHDGDVLVFLPGKGEIRQCADALRGRCRAELVEVHGGVPPSRLAEAFNGAGGPRRVFLSTNVAETSVTIPGVRSVVDSGLSRTRTHRAGRSVLSMEPIAESSMDQRAGRAGRVAAGRCVRLWSARFRPRAFDTPEIGRIELDDVLVRAAGCGVTARRFGSLAWVTPPPEFAVASARERLTGLGVLKADGAMTAAGAAASGLPVGAAEGLLLADAPKALRPDLVDIVAVSSRWRQVLLPIDALPTARRDAVQVARATLFEGAQDEVTRALRTLRKGDIREHHLHAEALREMRKIATQLRGLLKAGAGNADGIGDRAALVAHTLQRWPEIGFVARSRTVDRRAGGVADPRGEAWANGQEELRVRLTEARPAPVAGLVFSQEWLGSGGVGARGVGGLVLPCSLAELAAAGVGERVVAGARARRVRGSTRVEGAVRVELAGVMLLEEERPLRGAALLDALPDLIVRGSVLKGAADAVATALHTWAIARELERLACDAPPPLEVWLRARLEALGVEAGGDLDLLEVDDLVPDVAAETGVASWDLERLTADFPREWLWQDGRYVCEVRAAAGRVSLVATNKVAKRAKDPPKHVVPSFRGFVVELVNGSRRVRVR